MRANRKVLHFLWFEKRQEAALPQSGSSAGSKADRLLWELTSYITSASVSPALFAECLIGFSLLSFVLTTDVWTDEC